MAGDQSFEMQRKIEIANEMIDPLNDAIKFVDVSYFLKHLL